MKRGIILSLLTACLLVAGTVYADTAGSNTRQQIIELIQKEEAASATNPQQAESFLVQAAQISPDFPQIYEAWGHLYEDHLQFARAEEKYRKWAELQPDSYIPYVYLGIVEQRQLHYAESNAYFTKAKNIHATVGVIDSICHNFMQLKQWQDAISACTEAIALDQARYKKTDDYALNERSMAYTATGQKDKAAQDRAAITGNTLGTLALWLFGSLALVAIMTGAKPLLLSIRKKPLLYSSLLGFLPVLVICTFVIFFPEVGLPVKVAAAFFFVLLLWTGEQSYQVFGIDSGTLKKTLLSVLDELHVPWQEKNSGQDRAAHMLTGDRKVVSAVDNLYTSWQEGGTDADKILARMKYYVVQVPSAHLDIRMNLLGGNKNSATLSFKQKNRDNHSKELVQNILEGLKKRFAQEDMQIPNSAVIWQGVAYRLLGYAALFLFVYFSRGQTP